MTPSRRREPAREPACATAPSPAATDRVRGLSRYRPEYVAAARNAAALGATPGKIAAALGVTTWTLRNWAMRRPEFADALKAGCVGDPTPRSGHPRLYRRRYAAVARKAAELGGTQAEIAKAIGVSERTLYNWAVLYADFAAALKVGKAVADDRVERALYHWAVGFTQEGVKLTVQDGEVVATPFVEHHPPDVRAAIFWLKNRRPGEWREKHAHEISAAPGGAPLPALKVVFVKPSED